MGLDPGFLQRGQGQGHRHAIQKRKPDRADSQSLQSRKTKKLQVQHIVLASYMHCRGGSRNSLKGGGGSGPEFFEGGGGGLGSRSVGIFIY